MSNEEFLERAKKLVKEYTEEKFSDDKGAVPYFEVYIVWSCKTLQNSKALLGTTFKNDVYDMYYEVTYNGDKNEIYFDAYNKELNKCIEVGKEK